MGVWRWFKEKITNWWLRDIKLYTVRFGHHSIKVAATINWATSEAAGIRGDIGFDRSGADGTHRLKWFNGSDQKTVAGLDDIPSASTPTWDATYLQGNVLTATNAGGLPTIQHDTAYSSGALLKIISNAGAGLALLEELTSVNPSPFMSISTTAFSPSNVSYRIRQGTTDKIRLRWDFTNNKFAIWHNNVGDAWLMDQNGSLQVRSLAKVFGANGRAVFGGLTFSGSEQVRCQGDLRTDGSIVVTGNVDGRNVSTDGSTLDGHTTSIATLNNVVLGKIHWALPMMGAWSNNLGGQTDTGIHTGQSSGDAFVYFDVTAPLKAVDAGKFFRLSGIYIKAQSHTTWWNVHLFEYDHDGVKTTKAFNGSSYTGDKSFSVNVTLASEKRYSIRVACTGNQASLQQKVVGCMVDGDFV